MQKSLILAACIVGLLTACSDEDNSSPTGLLYQYIPTNVGHELIYDVSLITKDEATQVSDTSYYQVKELIESVIIDNQGRPTQRLERFRRDSVTGPWIIQDVWTSNLTTTQYEKKEENYTYVKLIFPITAGGTWNGNALNALDAQDFQYASVNNPASIGGNNFDSTLTVLQQNLQTFIDTVYAVERFATGVGMVYKEEKIILVDYTIPSQVGIKAQRLYKEVISSWNN